MIDQLAVVSERRKALTLLGLTLALFALHAWLLAKTELFVLSLYTVQLASVMVATVYFLSPGSPFSRYLSALKIGRIYVDPLLVADCCASVFYIATFFVPRYHVASYSTDYLLAMGAVYITQMIIFGRFLRVCLGDYPKALAARRWNKETRLTPYSIAVIVVGVAMLILTINDDVREFVGLR